MAPRRPRASEFSRRAAMRGDVLIERDAQLFGPFANILAAHAFGAGLVLQACDADSCASPKFCAH
jgi:hypothetical protein